MVDFGKVTAWVQMVETFVQSRRPGVKLSVDLGGKKYHRIVEHRDGRHDTRSVYCFVDANSGAILKADSWKRPAKGVRGYIDEPNGSIGHGITEYGATYWR